jgi:hypothetical protein
MIYICGEQKTDTKVRFWAYDTTLSAFRWLSYSVKSPPLVLNWPPKLGDSLSAEPLADTSSFWYAIGRSGQSLAYGAEGNPTRHQVATNPRAMMLGSTVRSGSGDGNVPLVPDLDLQPLAMTDTESIDYGYAAQISNESTPPVVFFYHGWAGYSLLNMNPGTVPFGKGIAQLKRIVEIAKARGKKIIVPCVDWISGENDSASWTTFGSTDATRSATYKNYLLNYHEQINQQYKVITGQAQSIKMVFCQTSSHVFYKKLVPSTGVDYPTIAIVMSDLARDYPDRFILAGAKYHLPYGSDRSVHLNALGYERWGEKRGEIFDQSVIGSTPWRPLTALAATMPTTTTIKVEMDVMFAPLRFDPAIVDPGAKGFAFESTGGNTPTIADVAISGNSVILTLSAAPTGTNKAVTYAWNNADPSVYTETLTPGQYARGTGPTIGVRGQLSDSDPAISKYGNDMRNYAIHFRIPVT